MCGGNTKLSQRVVLFKQREDYEDVLRSVYSMFEIGVYVSGELHASMVLLEQL